MIRVSLFDNPRTVFSGRTFYLRMILGGERNPMSRLPLSPLVNFDTSAV